jgi:predicted nucleic acid-binding protein
METTPPPKPQASNPFHILIDSDAFVGRINPDDAHHERANRIFQVLAEKKVRLVTTSFVVAETATVLSHRVGQSLAQAFLEVIQRGNIPVIHIDEALQAAALDLFSEQTKKGTSVTDCANVAVVRRLGITEIFSFDQGYPKRFGVMLAGG